MLILPAKIWPTPKGDPVTTTSVTVRHNFETGHRLPILEGKCHNLHGHSWWAEVTVEAPTGPDTIVEFGLFKRGLRQWIDDRLDHGLMLGRDDLLSGVLSEHGKVFVFGRDHLSENLMWPTVENVAELISRVASAVLADSDPAAGARVTAVRISETHVNAAGWKA